MKKAIKFVGQKIDPEIISENVLYAKYVESGRLELFYLNNTSAPARLTDDGYLNSANSFKRIGLYKQAADMSPAADKAFIYAKGIGDRTELFYMDDSGSAVQVTSDGILNYSLSHSIGGADHTADTLANLNSKISDASLFNISQFDDYRVIENIPYFERDDVDSYNIVYADAAPGASSTLAIRLNDGYLYTAEEPLVCDIDSYGVGGRDATETSMSISFWNLFAVSDTGGEFGLVFSQEAPADEPPSHPVFKYLWTVRVGQVSPTEIDEFVQAGSWCYQHSWDSVYELLDATISANVDWTSLKTELQAAIPTAVSDAIDISSWSNITTGVAGSGDNKFYLAPGDSISLTVSDFFAWDGQYIEDEAKTAAASRSIVPLKNEAISYKVAYNASEDALFRVCVRGYRNMIYPGQR